MYTRQHRTSKQHSHQIDTPVNNHLLPGRFIYQPKLEEVTPQQTATNDTEAKTDEETPQHHGFIDGAIFSRQVTRPEPRGIQMKLNLGTSEEKYKKEVENQHQAMILQQLTQGEVIQQREIKKIKQEQRRSNQKLKPQTKQ